MVFHITFMLALFHDKKCCNIINLFSCTLWYLTIMGLVLSDEDLIKIVEGHHEEHMLETKESVCFATWPTHEMTREMH